MKDPILFRRTDTLSLETAAYWKDLLYRTVKMGVELEAAPPKGMKRQLFEDHLRHDLSPSGTVEQLGVNGVWDVQTEHCGVEIRVVGRQPYFPALQKQYKAIMDTLLQRGARPRPTCGLHYHLLTPGLAEPMPEIIVANLWNLTRRYAPELKFISSAGHGREALCRRRNHNSHRELVRRSPGSQSMAAIQQVLKESRVVPEHQNFLNLEHLRFTDTGDVFPFHIEFRYPDAHLSATAVTATTFLFLSMLLKAVDLSCYGVIHVGKIRPWRRKREIMDMLSNNDGALATSDTSGISDEIIEELRQGAYELLDLLSPAFDRFENNPALDVLLALAETPISLLRCAGYDAPQIEAFLSQRAFIDEMGLDQVDQRLMQRIELGEWAGQPSTKAWQWYVARELYLTLSDLERRLAKLEQLRGLRWNGRQGTMVFTS